MMMVFFKLNLNLTKNSILKFRMRTATWFIVLRLTQMEMQTISN